MPCEDYLKLSLSSGEAYVRKDRISQIRKVDGIIFDCDGVLIDIRESYNKAISKSVAYILERMIGCEVSEGLISNEIIYLFRKTGGFNCDWDTVYGILMFILSRLPKETQMSLGEIMEKLERERSPFKRLMLMEEAVKERFRRPVLNQEFFSESIRKLKDFTGLLDSTGRESVDRSLMNLYGSDEDFRRFYGLLKRFLHRSVNVEESIIARVVEEFFCGAKLFRETYGVTPRFNNGLGLIENERLIVRPETLDALASILGKRNLGIASGSRCKPAEYILGDLIEKFNPDALVFVEDIEEAERLRGENLKKPHPYSLLRAAEGFEDSTFLMYVGDSMEDAIMAVEDVKLKRKILFTGVYRYTGFEEKIIRSFLDYGCDIIIPTVNELPVILRELGGRNVESR